MRNWITGLEAGKGSVKRTILSFIVLVIVLPAAAIFYIVNIDRPSFYNGQVVETTLGGNHVMVLDSHCAFSFMSECTYDVRTHGMVIIEDVERFELEEIRP